MRLYIDKENIESFILQSRNVLFEQCNVMLKKHFEMHLNVSIEEFGGSELCMQWGNTLLDGRGTNNIKFDGKTNEKLIPRPIDPSKFDENFEKEDASAVYLLNDPKMVALEDQGKYLVGGVGSELQILSKLIIGNEDSMYSNELEPLEDYFKDGTWNALNTYVTPSSEVLICDAYVLSCPDRYEQNIIALLDKIFSEALGSTLKVTIFCLQKIKKEIDGPEEDLNFNAIRTRIQKYFIEKSLDITFVAVKDKRVLGEHDRTVVTNYMHYIPGATLNFFSPSLDFVSEGRYFHVRSLGYSKYLQLAFRFVDDMQKLVNDIISRKKDGVINHGATTIPSHYLTFS